MDTVNVAIVGATGAVGEAVVELLQASTFPVEKLHLLASERTAGTSLLFRSQPVIVEVIESFDFSQVNLAIFVATDDVSREFVPIAESAGCLVIDNSRAFEKDAPLILPEVNSDQLLAEKKHSLVVNPDSTVVALCTVLKPIFDVAGLVRVNVTTYDSVSRHGKKAINELAAQTASLLNAQGALPKFFEQQIAFNILPGIGEMDENGHTESENRIAEQSLSILGDKQLQINVTCVQVPVFYADGLVVNIETADPIDTQTVKEVLEKHKEIKVFSESEPQEIVSPVTTAAGKDKIFVSRIRHDMGHKRGINLWLVADNVRKGAALNTILIAEELKKIYL